MIYDHLEKLATYKGLHPNLDKALEALEEASLSDLEPGRHEIDGDKAFLLIQDNTLNPSEVNEFEFHHNYLDLHVLVEGKELIKYGFGDRTSLKNYDSELDFGLESCECQLDLFIDSSYFTIFFPGEAHRPNGHAGFGDQVRKCVIKVLID